MRRSVLFVSAFLLTVVVSLCWGEIPKLINYQGMLTDAGGTPIDGARDLTFKIYDDTTGGGTLQWSETQSGVDVDNGLFNVTLGKSTALNLAFDKSYWLEVEVQGNVMPRIRFTSMGYAYQSRWAERSDTADYALSSPSGPGDYIWTFRITDGGDTTITTGSSWGIARYGNMLYGNADSTHVNLGVASTTGLNGQNRKYCTVGGGALNLASGEYATISGGVNNWAISSRATAGGGYYNTISGYSATVGGGDHNNASGDYATLGGGKGNIASEEYTTIGGGYYNTASGEYATVGGGDSSTVSGDHATVGGGYFHIVSGDYATVGGGYRSRASGYSATVGGGKENHADTLFATVGGGGSNYASAYFATVGGGDWNIVSGEHGTVGGGGRNRVSGKYAIVGGGYTDTASGRSATVGGGDWNNARGDYATVPGGEDNTASGNYSFAAGRRAKANHRGTFVWADSSVNADFASTGNNQFLIRAAGGVGIGTTTPNQTLTVNGGIAIQQSSTPKYHLDYYGGGLNFSETGVADYRIFIKDGGTVGIGTNDPSGFKLAVNGTAAKPGGGVWSTFSDERLKDVCAIYECGLSEINQLKPVRYRYQEGNALGLPSGQEFVGLIAQEVRDVIPNAVNENEQGYLMLDSDPIIWAMLNAIKELKAENELLRKRVEALENK